MCHCVFRHTLFPGAKAKGGTEDWVLPHEDIERGTLRAEVAPPFRASPQTCRRMCCMLPSPRTPPALPPYLWSSLDSHHCCVSPALQPTQASLIHLHVFSFPSVIFSCLTPFFQPFSPSQLLPIHELSSAPSSLAWLIMAVLSLNSVVFRVLHQKHHALRMAGSL